MCDTIIAVTSLQKRNPMTWHVAQIGSQAQNVCMADLRRRRRGEQATLGGQGRAPLASHCHLTHDKARGFCCITFEGEKAAQTKKNAQSATKGANLEIATK